MPARPGADASAKMVASGSAFIMLATLIPKRAACAARAIVRRHGFAGMDLIVAADGIAEWNGRRIRCALGRGGVRADKREGDGATPAGTWRMRALLFRPDRIPRTPLTGLPLRGLRPEDGWCDDPGDALYNRPVKFPFRGRAERLWREDEIYDLVVIVGFNDDPPVPEQG